MSQLMEDLTTLLDNINLWVLFTWIFQKAFDSVPHERLLQKMKAYGITGSILNWNFLYW